ncbi:MAG: hypothetical protein IPO21_02280 [Bacteroidales bacterium]|nr:hypothetical protein [Bacteroidales bacterium]
MTTYIIKRNGFDLAHGLETSYTHFISELENQTEKYGFSPRQQ